MVRLVATPALDFAPETIGDVAIAPAREGRVTSLAPFRGRRDAIAAALDAIGLGWPGPDRRSTAGAASIHWAGRGRALLFREDVPDFGDDAAVIDMTGAEAVLTLDGPAARDVLAVIGVRMKVGQMVFTRILCLANSIEEAFVTPSMPNFEPQ